MWADARRVRSKEEVKKRMNELLNRRGKTAAEVDELRRLTTEFKKRCAAEPMRTPATMERPKTVAVNVRMMRRATVTML